MVSPGYDKPGAELPDNYAELLYELAGYYLRAGEQEQGFRYVFKSLEASAELGSETCVIRCVRLFEQYRPQASAAQQEDYKKLINKVQTAHARRHIAPAGKL